MVINHNISALNANRNMGVNNKATSSAMEKLSSGLRINRAGDDAAGLAISEKMRAQIRGLDKASSNAQDGISLIETGEGALNETTSILQRMRELAVQSANDTNVSVDRDAIQDEIDALTKEVDRISTDTEFYTQKLLDGTFTDKNFQIGANTNQTISVSINKMDAASLGLTATSSQKDAGTYTKGDAADTNKLAAGTYTVKGNKLVDSTGKEVANVAVDGNAKTLTLTDANSKTSTYTFNNKLTDGEKITVAVDGKATADFRGTLSGNSYALGSGDYEISGTKVLRNGKELTDAKLNGAKIDVTVNGETVSVTAAELGLSSLADGSKFTINGVNVGDSAKASGAIKTINDAIEVVSTQRAKLGAVQNRLEHTIKNLDTSSENLSAAESRIRDVDMAKMMMEYSKNNILSQAAQAMLAQANQAPQQVLQLLR